MNNTISLLIEVREVLAQSCHSCIDAGSNKQDGKVVLIKSRNLFKDAILFGYLDNFVQGSVRDENLVIDWDLLPHHSG